MILASSNDLRFADAEDEDEYQRMRVGKQKTEEVESSESVTFDPPLYLQRYGKVVQICKDLGVTSVADLGCAELTLFQYFKNMGTISRVVSVDIDQGLLAANQRKIRPLFVDYLNLRELPLSVSVLCGSALEFDSRVAEVECVCAIELIEHLHIPDVEPFTHNIFCQLRPKHAIISTPNKDFNVLFDFVPGQVRHWDHKFEWTRAEFETWCEGVRERYGYDYTLTGVGSHESDESFGFCSQFAVFTRKTDTASEEGSDTNGEQRMTYVEVLSVEYPVQDPSVTPDTKLTHELIYTARQLGMALWSSEGEDVSCVAISELQSFPAVQQYGASDEHVARLVEMCGELELSMDRRNVVVRNVPPDEEERSSCSEGEESFGEEVVFIGQDEEEEEW